MSATATKRVYVSGPISLDGRATPREIEINIAVFRAAEEELRSVGCEPLSPLDNGLPQEASWADHMRADLAMLLTADEIVMLPRWQESRGASLELFVATSVGIPARFV